MKKERITKIISYILSLILSTLFTALSYVFCVYFSYFSVSSLESSLFSSGYYMEAYDQFCTEVKDIVIPTGFPYEIFSDITDAAYMKNTIVMYIHDFKEVDTEEIEGAVKENAEEYLAQEGIEITDGYDEAVSELAFYIGDSFKEKVANKWFLYLRYARNRVLKYIRKFIIPLVVLTAMAIVMLFLIQKWKHRACRYLVYSSTATAVLSAAGPIALYISGIYKKLYIQPKYFYNFAMLFIENGLRNMCIVAVGWMVFAVLCLFYIKYSKKELHRMHKI